jgi:hypothetical protein
MSDIWNEFPMEVASCTECLHYISPWTGHEGCGLIIGLVRKIGVDCEYFAAKKGTVKRILAAIGKMIPGKGKGMEGVIITADGTVEQADEREPRDDPHDRCLKCGTDYQAEDADHRANLNHFNMAGQEIAICDDCNHAYNLVDPRVSDALLGPIHDAIEQAAAYERYLEEIDLVSRHRSCPDSNCPTCRYNEPMIRAIEKAHRQKPANAQ